jgi:hypothetical protein
MHPSRAQEQPLKQTRTIVDTFGGNRALPLARSKILAPCLVNVMVALPFYRFTQTLEKQSHKKSSEVLRLDVMQGIQKRPIDTILDESVAETCAS